MLLRRQVFEPLEVRYHHRWVSRVVGYFLDPWADWQMDFWSVLDYMILTMDSRLEVMLSTLPPLPFL